MYKINYPILVKAVLFTLVIIFGFLSVGCSSSSDTDQSDTSGSTNPPLTPPEEPPVTPPVNSGAVKAAIYDATVVEGADDLEFVISLSAASSNHVSIDFSTVDGTAIADTDYTASMGTLTFAPGETRKFITIDVLENHSAPSSSSKSLSLELSNPENAELSTQSAIGSIIDREFMTTDNPFNHNWGSVGVFADANSCADCHESDGIIMQYDNTDVSPSTQWKHSVMANSFNDPYWQAAVQDEVDIFPHLSGFIEDTCTTCHAPMGRTHAHNGSLNDGSNLDAENHYRFDTAKDENHAREGVSCTSCHLMQEGGDDSGAYVISETDTTIYGPYANPRINPMNNMSGYVPQHSSYIQSSEMCASCHTLYTPAIDPATAEPSGPNTGLASATNGFLEQGPFLEWQNSSYANGQAQEAQCQDCHMPPPSNSFSTPISTMGNVSSREPFSQHTMVGGNAHLLEILSEYRSELGIAGSTSEDGFNDQIALTRNFLDGAANLSVSTPQAVGDTLEFDIEVTNNAGHKIPSAYPSRRTWLHVKVEDDNGDVIFESGKPDSRGYISTDEARLKADCMSAHKFEGFNSNLCYEPHRDVIDDPSQVAIYETVLGDVNGNITHTLLYGAQYLKDNRIPPVGFTNNKAETIEIQTLPSGVEGDGDFNCIDSTEGCGADTVHYQVNIEGSSGPYSVEARLLYQATQPAFVDGMHTTGDRVNRFKVMYDQVPPSVEVLAIASD